MERNAGPPFDVVPAIAARTTKRTPVLLVANKHDDTLCFIDPEGLEILDTIPTGPNPHEIVVTPDQRYAYFSNYAAPGDTISVVDLVARKHIKQISTGEYTRIHGAAMAPDGRHAYFTAGQTGFVVEIDTAHAGNDPRHSHARQDLAHGAGLLRRGTAVYGEYRKPERIRD